MTFSWLDTELSGLSLSAEADKSRKIICEGVQEYFSEQELKLLDQELIERLE